MIQSNSSAFTDDITKKFQQYETDIIPHLVGNDICKTLKNSDKQQMFNYQLFLMNYMKSLNEIPEKDLKQRGLLVFHKMGSGKSTSAILMSEGCRNYNLTPANEDYNTRASYKRKVVLLTPANLFFDPWIKELASKCFEDCALRNKLTTLLKNIKNKTKDVQKKMLLEELKTHDYHFVFYNAQNVEGGWRDKLKTIPTRKNTADKYTNMFSERNNEFDDSVVIIDEIHNLINMFANKLEKDDMEGMLLYNKLMSAKNMKIIALTGTPIVNKPIEIALLANLIRGNIEGEPGIRFKLDIDHFNNLFFNDSMTGLKNRKMLSRRLTGLVSYYKGIDNSAFANKVEDKVLVPFSRKQEMGYNIAQRLELKDIKKSTSETAENVYLYRIKASNVVFPNYMFNKKSLAAKKLKKNGRALDVLPIANNHRLLNTKITKEDEKTIIKMLNNDSQPLNIDNELSDISKKVYHIIKYIQRSNGPVLVFSRFEGLFGIKFIAEALKQNNFQDYDKSGASKTKDTFMRWTGKQRNNKAKELFNSTANADGSKIKVFLMTTSGKEGINLMGIRQIHILEPWWNNVVDRQVIARGIRICSHSHIKDEDFIDFGLDEVNKLYDTPIVNVFKYYGYIDMRNKLKKNLTSYQKSTMKKAIILDMKATSIDDKIMQIAARKQQQEELITDVLKEVAIDCNINKERNGGAYQCFRDYKYGDYFKAWNMQDNYLPIITNDRIKMVKGDKYIVSQDNVVYEYKDNYKNISNNLSENKPVKVGKYVDGKIVFDDFYKKQEDKMDIKKIDVVFNYYKHILEKVIKIKPENKSILDITTVNKNTVLLSKIFKKIDILNYDSSKKSIVDKMSKVKKVSRFDGSYMDINKQKYDFIHIDPNIENVAEVPSLEYMINFLSNTSYIMVKVAVGDIKLHELINKYHYDKKYGLLIVNKKKLKNSLVKFLTKQFNTIGDWMTILEDLHNNKIDDLADLKLSINKKSNFMIIDHTMAPEHVKKINKLLLTKKQKEVVVVEEIKSTQHEDCLKSTLSKIKKTVEYKKLKGRSKIKKKKDLCDALYKNPPKPKTQTPRASNLIDSMKANVDVFCANTTLQKLKKSKEYKNLPKGIGKSKMSKKDLCAAIMKYN